MEPGYVSQDQRRAAVDRIEVYARSMCAIHGLPAPGPEVLSPIIDSTVACLTPHQMRHPHAIPPATLGDLHQALLRVAQTNKAVNLYGADAPADGKGDRGFDKGGLKGADAMDRMRGAALAARYRDADGGTGDSGTRAGNAGSSRLGGGYQALDLNSPQSLQQLTGTGWGKTAASLPYARAGIDFGTVKDLRNYDPKLTGQDVLKAASDAKQLGFDPNDKRAMRDHAVIRHYDNDADATNGAEKKFKANVDGDKDMQELLRQRGLCKDPVQQKALDAQIEQHTKQHLGESGLQRRLDDPKNHPKAKAAIKDDVDHIVHQHDRAELKAEQKAEVGSRAKGMGSAIKPRHAGAARRVADAQDKNNTTFKKLDVASLNKNDQDDWGSTAVSASKMTDPKKAAEARPEPPKAGSVRVADAKPAAGPKPT